jgi:hypothetical protein
VYEDKSMESSTSKHIKRKLSLVEDRDQLPERYYDDLTSSTLNKKQKYQVRKKNWRREKHWTKHGHLPTTSTKRNFIGNAEAFTTPHMIANSQIKDGGYTSKSSCYRHTPDLRSLEEAISLGFLLVKSREKFVREGS